MQNHDIDRIIERYTEERKHELRQVAQAYFLRRIYLACSGSDVGDFLKCMRHRLIYRIDCLSLFDNPFRNSQVFWLLFVFIWICFSIFLMIDANSRLLGAVIGTGTLIFGRSLWQIIWTRWLDVSLLIAYYREIIDLIDSQQPSLMTINPA